MGEIIDLCKAEPSRNFRNSRLAKYDRIIECVKKQREEFVSYHDQVEIVRKERAAIIEGVVKRLKELDIKSNKPLGKYDNEGLIAELNRIIAENPEINTEDIEIAIVRIRNRYRDIQNITKKLKTYSRRIDNYPDEAYEPLMEDDYNDEIVITKDSFQTQDVIQQKEDTKEEDRVVEKHEASPGLLESLAEIIDDHVSKEDIFNDIEDLFESTEPEMESIVEEEHIEPEETIVETEPEIEITPIVTAESEDSVASNPDEISLTEEYASFTLNKNISLQYLVERVYEETEEEDTEDLWVGVYNYRDNHEQIDAIAEELGVSVDCVATTPGLLNGVTLKFPTDLVTYHKVEEQENYRKVA